MIIVWLITALLWDLSNQVGREKHSLPLSQATLIMWVHWPKQLNLAWCGENLFTWRENKASIQREVEISDPVALGCLVWPFQPHPCLCRTREQMVFACWFCLSRDFWQAIKESFTNINPSSHQSDSRDKIVICFPWSLYGGKTVKLWLGKSFLKKRTRETRDHLLRYMG